MFGDQISSYHCFFEGIFWCYPFLTTNWCFQGILIHIIKENYKCDHKTFCRIFPQIFYTKYIMTHFIHESNADKKVINNVQKLFYIKKNYIFVIAYFCQLYLASVLKEKQKVCIFLLRKNIFFET